VNLVPWAFCFLALTVPLSNAADNPTPPSVARPSAKVPSAEALSAARAAIRTLDWTAALRHLEAALRADPRNPDVHTFLGFTYRKRPQPDLVLAFQSYTTALQIDPFHKGAHEYIGEAYLMQGKLPEARDISQRLKQFARAGLVRIRDLAEAIAAYRRRVLQLEEAELPWPPHIRLQ
jgi:Flp pilus assembly protein TadD